MGSDFRDPIPHNQCFPFQGVEFVTVYVANTHRLSDPR